MNTDEPAIEGTTTRLGALGAGPLLVTVKQAGDLLRCGKTKIFDMINEGILERRKLGSATRITMASIRKIAGV